MMCYDKEPAILLYYTMDTRNLGVSLKKILLEF